MMRKIAEWKKEAKAAENKRIGDIYAECQRLGVQMRFLQAFDTRAWLFPVEQTRAFIDAKARHTRAFDADSALEQWGTYLRVLIKKRPEHEKVAEWEKALAMLKQYDE